MSKAHRSRARRNRTPLSLRRRCRPVAEILEPRLVLSNMSWTGGGGDNLWSDPANWSDDQLPGAGDDVAINQPGSFTIIYDASAGDTTLDSLNGSDALLMTGGALTIATTATPVPTSTLTGSLTFEGGSMLASGSATVLTANGPVTALSGSLAAQSGASLSLPGLTSVDGIGMSFGADGSGSTLDLSAATSFGGSGDAISQTNNAAVLLNGGLTNLDGTTVTLDGTGTDPISGISSLTDGGLTIENGKGSERFDEAPRPVSCPIQRDDSDPF